MTLSPTEAWQLIHAERTRLANMLDGLTDEQWVRESLCAEWRVEQVVAHLTAAAHTGTLAWMRSIVLAGFNAERHNARRLVKYLGNTVQETGENFRRSVSLTVAPTRDYAAWLGEVIVHGQDIARPLGIPLTPNPVAILEVARFFATKDFAVNSHKAVLGLTLEASDHTFTAGHGPMVRGPLLSLVMAMAGRRDYCAELEGDGVAVLCDRIA